MNIIIPMGGIGSRFTDHGYRLPKPMINILGRPMVFWLLDYLSISADDTVFIALNRQLDAKFHIFERFREEFSYDIQYVPLDLPTRGAAETLDVVLQQMSHTQLERKTISLDCDTFYFEDILKAFRSVPSGYGASFYFTDTGKNPIYSYIQFQDSQDSQRFLGSQHLQNVETDQSSSQSSNQDSQHVESDQSSSQSHDLRLITDIAEKKKISDHANTGAYAFASGSLMRDQISQLLSRPAPSKGEYYTSSLIKIMLENKHPFLPILVKDFAVVGTHPQLLEFFDVLKNRPTLSAVQRRFCFDLDNTLLTYPIVRGDYSTCQPMEKNVALVRQLKSMGHYIIIYTDRKMKTHNANIGAVLKDVGLVTMQSLQDLNIPYDELCFGKPQADIYIDDLAVNALVDTERELGWCAIQAKDQQSNMALESETISFQTITKIGPKKFLSYEAFFLSKGLDKFSELKSLFPTYVAHASGPDDSLYLSLMPFEGTSLLSLYKNNALDKRKFQSLMDSVASIHLVKESSPTEGTTLAPSVNDESEAWKHYYEKMASKFEPLGMDSTTLKVLKDKLGSYEPRRFLVNVVHGDLWFQNVFLKPDGFFIFDNVRPFNDPNLFTTEGDAVADLSTILLSLHGIRIDKAGKIFIEPNSELDSFLRVFSKTLSRYKGLVMNDITYVAAFFCITLALECESHELKKSLVQKAHDLLA